MKRFNELTMEEKLFHIAEFNKQMKRANQIWEHQMTRLYNFYHNSPEKFKNLFLSLCKKHDEKYRDTCYSRGFEPYPKLLLVYCCEFFKTWGKEMTDDEIYAFDKTFNVYGFQQMGVQFNGFTVLKIFGQGTGMFVYVDGELILTI